MSVEVTERTIPSYTAASLRDVIPTYADEPLLWNRLMASLGHTYPELASYTPPDGVPASVALFHDDGPKQADVDVEVRLAVPDDFVTVEEAIRVTIPAQRVVSALLRGSYEGMEEISNAIFQEIGKRGLQPVGNMFNVYIVSPNEATNPEDWVTEVCFPVA